jgi:YVTN family beta-propeller protein
MRHPFHPRWHFVLLACASFTLSGPRAWGDGSDGVPSRSTNIALTSDERRLLNVNVDTNSVTLFRVKDAGDETELIKLKEIPVGREPHSIAVHPDDSVAFVTNSASGTVSVIDLEDDAAKGVVEEIPVGTEPRGCALTPNGKLLFVANHTAGTVSVIKTSNLRVIDTARLGGNPQAIAITDDGDESDGDETVFVTQFFAELIPGGPGEGFDDGKQAIVHAFKAREPGTFSRITLSPVANSGFTADRTPFCTKLSTNAVNDTFCPNPDETDANSPTIKADPQAVFPNQLYAALIRNDRLFLPNIGAQPEPPVRFNVNVQALVHVVDAKALAERAELHVNLNAQIATEPDPENPTESLGKVFGNDIVAIDSDRAGKNFLILSRGGNYVLRARLDQEGKLNIGAPNGVVRLQTGNIPTGVVMTHNGKRAFVNNEVGLSVSILDLEGDTVLARDVPSSTPPVPGSFHHSVLLGKLVFFTALGVPDNDLTGLEIRDIDPLQFRGKQSSNGWSTCASCHPSGLADGVTWIFPDGPRQTIPLDGLYSKVNGAHDTRINNWSAARDSVTDFNNNSRAVQGGVGFASEPPFSAQAPNPAIFDHGISQGASGALDVETLWAQTVRPLNLPAAGTQSELDAGAAVFGNRCASCHGGAKWTKSQVLYLNDPALNKAFAAGGTPRDPGLTITANQMVSYVDAKVDTGTLKFLENVGTFNAAGAIEIRGAGGAIGQRALGTTGFNVPSLLSTAYHAPFFHNGAAPTLEAVFNLHALPGGGTIQSVINDADRATLLLFLKSIDGRTKTFISDGDIFKDPTQNLP